MVKIILKLDLIQTPMVWATTKILMIISDLQKYQMLAFQQMKLKGGKMVNSILRGKSLDSSM